MTNPYNGIKLNFPFIHSNYLISVNSILGGNFSIIATTKRNLIPIPGQNGDIVLNEQEIDFDLNSHDKGINYKQLAYVIFTSGSTGIPKGVMISRDALAHYTNWAVSAIMPSDTDRWAQYANISFDLSVLDIFGALCSGATLYLVSKKIDEILDSIFLCEKTTLFGFPVVPEE